MPSIRKRNWTTPKGEEKTAWLVDYRDQAGARRSKQFARKKDADAWATRAAYDVSQGTHTHDRDSITVAVAAELWISAAISEKLERSTIKRYQELSRVHIVPKFGTLKLSTLTKAQIQQWRQDLLDKQSRAMASKIIRALSSILSNAMNIGAVAQNVAATVKVSKAKRSAEKIIPPDRSDLKKMIKAASDTERPFILTAITTGLSADSIYDEVERKAYFTVVVETDRSYLQTGSKKLPITPGMICNVDVMTGRKSVLSYLLKPFLKARSEALTER